MDNETLPPIPEPYWAWDAYTAEQMRAYALVACAERDDELLRCAGVLKTLNESVETLRAQLAQRDADLAREADLAIVFQRELNQRGERIRELEKVAGPDVVATLFGQNQRAMRAEQRAEAAEARVTELESRQWDPYPPDYRQKIEAAERSVELLRIENGMQHTKLVATELRLYELEQSAEVHARNMRDLVAEHVRERDALSERVRDLENVLSLKTFPEPYRIRAVIARGAQHDMALPIIEVLTEYPDMAVIVGTAGLTDEVAALRARLEAIYNADSFMAVPIENHPGPVTPVLVIKRQDLPT